MPKYVYPAVFTQEKEGGYSVNFPDVESCYTCGDSLIDAMEMATDVLTMMLKISEEEGTPIPVATAVKKIPTEKDSFVTLVMCNTDGYEVTYCEAKIHVKEIRRKSGLTVAELSEKSGVPADVIEDIESKEWGRVEDAFKLAKALDVEISEICEQEIDYDE